MDETFGTPSQHHIPPSAPSTLNRNTRARGSFRSSGMPSLDGYGSLERGFTMRSGNAVFTPAMCTVTTALGLFRAPAPTPHGFGGRGGNGGGGDDFEIRLDLVADTPVLVVPRHERSFEVLLAHLGEISVRNEAVVMDPLLAAAQDGRVDRLLIRVEDMSLHSLNLADRFQDHQGDSLLLLSQFRHMTSQVRSAQAKSTVL